MTPPRERTWGRRGHTPIVRGPRQVPPTDLRRGPVLLQVGREEPPDRPRFHLPFKGARKSCAWTDYRDLLVRAHIQLGSPIVVVWDNLDTHRTAGMEKYAAEHDWLTVFQLPSYAPDLNPVESVWSLHRHGPTANTAFEDPDHLIRTLRRGLRHIQLQHQLVDGCLAETGLTLTTPTPL
ncbi:transposase [Streptomyces sp. NBC_01643]|uniref:transposase n=1 Tax=Streptomyces sp. NBC_01643 TaxID=2975906 RepID=UPI002F90F608